MTTNWRKGTAVGLAVLAAAGAGVYALRRHLIAWWLHFPKPAYGVSLQRNIRIPMPDGVTLATDHYRPSVNGNATNRFPTIFIRTPYSKDGIEGLFHTFICHRFAERGYHVISQDTRGTFSSEGAFEPFVHEAEDGRTTLEWIAKQPWFNGSVGMWGMSYPGYTVWAAAATKPPMLKALVPAITGSYLGPEDGRIFPLDLVLNWMLILDSLLDENVNLIEMARRTGNLDHQRAILSPGYTHLPLSELDQVVLEKEIPFFKVWQDHPDPEEAYWQEVNYADSVSEVTAPVHLVSGWFDIFLPRLMKDYANLKAAGHNPYLTIGPWYHLDFDRFFSVREAMDWFDVYLKGKTERLRPSPVRIYLTGANQWLEFDSWPPPAQEAAYFLSHGSDSSGRLGLERPKDDPKPDSYTFDPADPTPNIGGPLLSHAAGSYDNRPLESRTDVLTYTSEPLNEHLDVIGTIRLTLYVETSLLHSDLFGRLCDVHPDGRSMNICDGLVRLGPDNVSNSDIVQVDGTLKVELEMIPTAHRFLKGHCLRLQVSGGAHPRFARNLGTDEPIPTATRMEKCETAVYLDDTHPSALVLPVRVAG
ncbi:MAG: CocE/NonD family hydrolase [Candidatus Promineifilaceae bacterium]